MKSTGRDSDIARKISVPLKRRGSYEGMGERRDGGTGGRRKTSKSFTNNIAGGGGRQYFQAQVQFMRDAIGSLSELIDNAIICLDESYYDEGYIRYLTKRQPQNKEISKNRNTRRIGIEEGS
jgi:four helix bundle protein